MESKNLATSITPCLWVVGSTYLPAARPDEEREVSAEMHDARLPLEGPLLITRACV